MNFEKYIDLSEVTEAKFPDGLQLTSAQAETMHMMLGVSTEAGELLDALKKHLIYGKEMDWVNVQEEIGDLFWYIAGLLRLSGADPFQIMDTNIEKLKARFGDKFDAHKALNRDLDTEREILEGGV